MVIQDFPELFGFRLKCSGFKLAGWSLEQLAGLPKNPLEVRSRQHIPE